MTTKKKTKKTKKFTVTVKDDATTAAPAVATTTQASADATTGAVATTEAPASSDASSNALKKVTLSTTNPKVGDVITAVLDPVTANNVKGYTWYEDDVEVSGNATSSYTVTEKAVGKKIRVTVTDTNGTKFESNSSAAVVVDNSKSVVINDLSGFQADGTALVTDTLSLIFGDLNGLPKTITWYVNNTLVKSYNSASSAIDVDAIAYTGNLNSATGSCYAKVVTDDGTTYKTPEITIVKTATAATLTNVSISEDYATPAIDLNAKTTAFAVSVTLNKDYDGKFYLVEDTKDIVKDNCAGSVGSSPVAFANSSVSASVSDVVNPSDTYRTYSDSKYMTAANAITGVKSDDDSATVHVLKRVLETKEVQYIFAAKKDLTRGTKYKVVFEQAGVDSSAISDKANKTAITSDAVLADYVKAPTKIVVTDPQIASDKAGWTATLYSGEDVCKYIDITAANYADGTAKATLTANTSTSTTTGTPFDASTNIKQVTEGVFDGNPKGSCKGVANNSYVYAKFEGTAGVFGKEKLTLTSTATKTATQIVSSATLAVSTSDVKNVDFTLNNLVASADVYLLTATYDTNVAKTALAAVDKFKADKTKVGVVSVGPGNGSATIKDAISKVTNTTAGQGDVYTIAVIPQDEKAFAPYFGAWKDGLTPKITDTNSAITVSQIETTLKLANTTVGAAASDPNAATDGPDDGSDTTAEVAAAWTALTNNAVVEFLDQYGNKIATSKPIAASPMTPMQRNSGNADVSVIMNEDGKLTFLSTAAGGANDSCAEGDVYTFTLSAKFTLQATVKTTSLNKADTMDFIIVEK